MPNSDARRTPLESKRKLEVAFLSLSIGFVAQLCFAFDLSVAAAIFLYLLALTVYLFSLSKEESTAFSFVSKRGDYANLGQRIFSFFESKPAEIAIVLFLIAVGAFLRLHRIESQPQGIWIDETFTAVNALEILEGKEAPVWGAVALNRFRPEWVKTSNLYLYYVALVFKIFGPTHFGLKMVSVVPAIATIPVLYFLFKAISNSPIAFLATFLTAVSQWNITISRWGWDEVLMCFLQVLSYYFLVKGIASGKNKHLLFAGVIMGLCLYTYIASWIAFSIALGYLAAKPLLDREPLQIGMRRIFLFCLPCFLVFTPLAIYYISYPGDFLNRASEVNILTDIRAQKSYWPVWENIKKYGLMFNYNGDRNPGHNLPGYPELDFLTALFFVFGLAACLRFWRASYKVLLLLWMVLGIQGGILSHSDVAPNVYRTAMINPVACYFAGSASFYFLTGLYCYLADFRFRAIAVLTLASLMLAYVTFDNYTLYFDKRPVSLQVWEEENLDWGIPAQIKSARETNAPIFLDPMLIWDTVIVNSWFLNYRPGRLLEHAYVPSHIFYPPDIKPFANLGSVSIVYIAPPPLLAAVRHIFPEAKFRLISKPSGTPLYFVFALRVSDWQARLKSADRSELADLIYAMGKLYKTQAPKHVAKGPMHKFLSDQAEKEFTYAKQLNPNLRD